MVFVMMRDDFDLLRQMISEGIVYAPKESPIYFDIDRQEIISLDITVQAWLYRILN